MAYTEYDSIKKKLFQAGALISFALIPATGGLSLLGTAGIYLASTKYNSFLQSDDEKIEENKFGVKKKYGKVLKKYHKFKNEENKLMDKYSAKEERKLNEEKIFREEINISSGLMKKIIYSKNDFSKDNGFEISTKNSGLFSKKNIARFLQ